MAEELPPFDPQWLAAEQMMGGRVVIEADSIEKTREKFVGIFAGLAPFIPPPTDAVRSEDVQLTPTQRVRIYTPSGGIKPLPVGLYIHSGGWFTGSIEGEDHLCRTIAEKSNVILFSPDYRLAPENPYPAGLDDVCAAYEFMHAKATEYGGDQKRKLIMGGSAGGNLAACVALKYASNQDLKPAGLVSACLASCDPLALPSEYKSRYTPERYSDAPMIGNSILQQARDWLKVPQPEDPLYSPLLHPDLKLLPKTYIAACTKDPTHQESVFFSEECRKQGVDVDLVEWVGWPHFFWVIPVLPKSAEFLDVWCAQLKAMVSS